MEISESPTVKRPPHKDPEWLLILSSVLFVTTVVFCLLFLVYFFKDGDKEQVKKAPKLGISENMQVCDTPKCLRAAALVAEKMDTSIDPCEDFHKYACGSFYKLVEDYGQPPIINGIGILQVENGLLLKAIMEKGSKVGDPDYLTNMRNLYRSCMNEEKIEEIGLEPFKNSSCAREWPTLIGEDWPEESSFELNDVLIRYMKIFVAPLFTSFASQDVKDPSRSVIIYFDHAGVLRNWWQPEDDTKFKQKSQCLVTQYGDFRDKSIELNVNGKLTLTENIADNSGLKESFMAYKKVMQEKGGEKPLPGLGLTNDQLFFLGYSQLWCDNSTESYRKHLFISDTHSLGKFRIIGPLQNSPEFAEAYKCPEGSKMNPAKKCSVW